MNRDAPIGWKLATGFERVDLERVDLERADLEHVDLEHADMHHADLQRANIESNDVGLATPFPRLRNGCVTWDRASTCFKYSRIC